MLCLLRGAVFVLVPAGQSPWLGPLGARLAVFRVVPCPRGSGGVCIATSVRLPEARVACLGGGSLGSVSSSLPQVFCDPVPWCSMSLTLLPWDITCRQVVCPGAGTLFVLPWGTRGLVSWCMMFSGLMCAGGFQG